MRHAASRPSPALLTTVFLSLLLAASQAGGAVVGKEPIKPVVLAGSVDSLKAECGKRLPETAGRMFALSPKIFLNDFMLEFGRQGILKEASILLPAEKGLEETDLPGIRKNLALGGIAGKDVTEFRLSKGIVRGTSNGIAFDLFPLTGIPDMSGKPTLVVIDPSLILYSWRNEVKTPIVELAWKLVLSLSSKHVDAREVVLVDLPPSDDSSLRYGFLSRLFEEMVSNPAAFKEELPEKWDILQQAENASFFGQFPEAMLLYRRFLDLEPKDASAAYKVAMMSLRDLDFPTALQWLNKAARIDPRYLRGYVEAENFLVEKKMYEPAERILLAAVEAFPEDARLANSLALFYLNRGIELQKEGDSKSAAEFLEEATRIDGADAALKDKARRLLKEEGSTPR